MAWHIPNLEKSWSGRRMIAILGIAATLLVWQLMKAAEREHIRGMTQLAAAMVVQDLDADVRLRVLGVKALHPAQLPTDQEWAAKAKLYLDDHPDCIALEFLDAKQEVRFVFEREQGIGQPGLYQLPEKETAAALKMAADTRNFVLTPSFDLSNGQKAHLLVAPTYAAGEPKGSVLAAFLVREALDEMFVDIVQLGYEAAVLEGDEEIFRASAFPGKIEQQWGQEVPLRLSGVTWRVRAWPTPKMLAQMRSGLPTMTLALGALVVCGLVLAAHFAESAKVKSRRLEIANEELSRAKAQRQELELRVRERTVELAETAALLRDVSSRVSESQDLERRRIARELRDRTARNVEALTADLCNLQKFKGDDPRLRSVLEHALRLVEQSRNEIRTMSQVLHPPILDERGLGPALQWYTGFLRQRNGVQLRLELDPRVGRLDPDLEVTLFRIADEALMNVYGQSGSVTASVNLAQTSEGLVLEIWHNGRAATGIQGMAFVSHGIGIAGLRERVTQLGGDLNISFCGSGTLIRTVLPGNQNRDPHLGAPEKALA